MKDIDRNRLKDFLTWIMSEESNKAEADDINGIVDYYIKEVVKENELLHSVSNSLPVKCKTIGMNGELEVSELSVEFAGETITELSRKLKIAEDFTKEFNDC